MPVQPLLRVRRQPQPSEGSSEKGAKGGQSPLGTPAPLPDAASTSSAAAADTSAPAPEAAPAATGKQQRGRRCHSHRTLSVGPPLQVRTSALRCCL